MIYKPCILGESLVPKLWFPELTMRREASSHWCQHSKDSRKCMQGGPARSHPLRTRSVWVECASPGSQLIPVIQLGRGPDSGQLLLLSMVGHNISGGQKFRPGSPRKHNQEMGAGDLRLGASSSQAECFSDLSA